jgi:hypothetical protein
MYLLLVTQKFAWLSLLLVTLLRKLLGTPTTAENYPNPFNPATRISFDLPQDSKVNLVVYDLLGREVKRLVNNEFKVAGTYTYDFNAASLSSGMYFYMINAGKFSETKRMVLLK